MMTQSVITQTANLYGNAAGSVTSKGKQTGSGFNLLIDNNRKANQNSSDNSDVKAAKNTSIQKNESVDSSKSDDTKSPTMDAAKAKDMKVTNETKTVKSLDDQTTGETKTTDDTQEIKANEDDTTAKDQLAAELVGMLQSIQKVVMNTLNLSPEELNQLLVDQGMTATDLLQPESLQKLVLANSGQPNILAILTDENLASEMNELLQKVDEIMTKANLSLTKEQIDSILSQLETKIQINSQVTSQSDVGSKANTSDEDNLTKQPEAVNAVSATMEEDSEVKTDANNNVTKTDLTSNSKKSSLGTQGETNNSDNKDLNKPDTFQTFVDNLVKTSKETQINFTGNMTQITEIREIANQIIEHVKVSISPDQSSMELQLNPEHLGKVNLTVQSNNGVMTAQFIVQNEISKEAIESQIQTLRETLSQQGIKVEAIEVAVATYSSNQFNQDESQSQSDSQKSNSGNKITLEDAFSMTDDVEDENVTEDITGVRGSQVDYTA